MEFVVILRCFILKWDLCSFPWWKEPKIKAVVLLLKRRSRFLLKIFPPRRFILFTPEMLILSVICCAASSKNLAFQFVHKTQQSQGQKGDYELGVRINKWNLFVVILKWFVLKEIFVLFLDEKNQKSRLRYCYWSADLDFFLGFFLRGASFCSLLKCWFCRWSAAQLRPKVKHFSSFTKPNNPKARGWFGIGSYDLIMKLIYLDFVMISFEMKSLFFSLIKRTKNQGCGIVFEVQSSNFFKKFQPFAGKCFLFNWYLSFPFEWTGGTFEKIKLIIMENHDLYHEFPELETQIHTLKTSNTHFKKLYDTYHTVNKDIHRIETGAEATSDEVLNELRVRRVHLKDELFELLSKN